ncbi:DUF3800 domain-containing protein [Paenibacillus residui]|uniref:DUF3800 domain-containing protein n=1 Tax=Paenibacillus residui TaxID=629724 RepID=A0ABW3D5W5_9BACL
MGSKYWIFQDESGEPGKDPYFIVGILGMTQNVKKRLLDSIASVRAQRGFFNEFHFQKFSELRSQVYKDALEEAFKCYFSYRAIVVSREDVDLSLFDYKRHLAYNKFSELLIYNHIKNRSEHIHIRPDNKNRMKEDNFYDYLVRNLNYKSFYERHGYVVKSCKSSDSKKCDATQICDLLTGVVKNKYSPAGERKNKFSNYFLNKYDSRINIWHWKPRK